MLLYIFITCHKQVGVQAKSMTGLEKVDFIFQEFNMKYI